MCLRILRTFLLPVLFAIALSPPSTFAQAPGDGEIAALKQHGFELFQAGKYADALPVAKRYAELIEGRYGLCSWTGFISPRRVGMSSETVG